MNKTNKVALVVLDGYGIGPDNPKVNAIKAANTPFMDKLMAEFPHATLKTFGENVGLPNGQMGNSEVGHMNLGAGRVVYQQLVLINNAFESGAVKDNPVLKEAVEYARKNNKKIHLLGLVSDGGVHSSLEHLKGLCDILSTEKNVFIHAFMDGRDTDPQNGKGYLNSIQEHIAATEIKIASIVGRYYAMDRDKRWERIKLAYDLLVNGVGEKFENPIVAIESSYQNGITDEFVLPKVITDSAGNPLTKIEDGDVVLFFNFRTDRGRELTIALTQEAFHEYNMHPLQLHYITMTIYDHKYKGIKNLFDNQDLSMTIGEVFEQADLTQLRAAETEKYPHVTFFFSGGREVPFEGEKRVMAPSPKVATYDLKPSMSAAELTSEAIKEIKTNDFGLVVLNYANPDMVGHTGVFSAVVEAVETVDTCLEKLVNTLLEKDYSIIILADHGNADFMVNEDGTPNTAHTTNLVPVLLVSKENKGTIKDGKLADIAPTLLWLAGLDIPEKMGGEVLIS